ncbi:MAG TPA: CHRD domain-containing protein, partial [Chitinophagaceae bacterium]|nr:CHRD domain-containing protein [Chitinophagaceae bacterium]
VMKTIRDYRKTFFALLATGIMASALLIACNKDNNNNNNNVQMYNTTGNASGSQVKPSSVTTSGTGTLSGTYNASTNVWQYNITWSTLSGTATAAELHGPADTTVAANLISALTITTPGVSGSASGNVTLTEQQEADLLAGKYYYTILTAAHVAGKIRGQITATPQ